MTKNLRIGLVGFGHWARTSYVPLISELPDVEVVSVAARSEGSREAAVEMLGQNISLHEDYSGLIEAGQVDGVMIALKTALNATAAVKALEKGLNTWVEPPFSIHGDTKRMLALAERGPAVFHCDLEPRYLPVVQGLRNRFSDGDELGRLRSIHLEHEMVVAPEYRDSSMLFGLGPWYVDLLDTFTESQADEVKLIPSEVRKDGLVVKGRVEVTFMSGASAVWSFSFDGPRDLSLTLSLVGENGTAKADLTTGKYSLKRTGGEMQSATADCTRPEAGYIGMRESLHAFVDAIRGAAKTLSGPDVLRRIQPTLVELARQETA